ncbi:MAG: hypothetical protein AB2806_07820 [Candidatus Thiodiazotropha sp.]
MSKLIVRTALISVLVAGCAGGSSANLTANPSYPDQYIFYYSKSIIEFQKNSVPVSVRFKNYEHQIEVYLKKDNNLSSCYVVPGSIDFGEPGSGGSAIVKCNESIPLVDSTASFHQDGKPVKRYWVNHKK